MTKPEPTRTTPAQRRTQQARQAIVRIAGVVPSPSRLLVESVADALLAAEQAAREEALGGKDVADAIRKAARRAALEEIAAHVEAERTRLDKQAIDLKLSGSKDLWHRVRGSAIELRCLLDWLRARAKENQCEP